MSAGKVGEEGGVRDDAEEESMKGGYRMEDKELTRRGAEVKGDIRIRKKILESVTEKFDSIQEESVNLEPGSQEEDDRKRTGSLGSRSLTTTLKRKVNEMKQNKEEKSSMTDVDKVTGHVEGLVMRMERMLTSGDDLNKERDMRFRESLETSYQSPWKEEAAGQTGSCPAQPKEQSKSGNKEQADMAS